VLDAEYLELEMDAYGFQSGGKRREREIRETEGVGSGEVGVVSAKEKMIFINSEN
jgi:hypothetical protein